MCLKILFFSMFLFQATIADDYQGQDAYIGCFIDNRTARDLNKLPGQIGNVWIGSNSNMTVAACLDLCRGFSLPYAGLEFGNECYCGDSFGRYGKADESECSYSCSGNMNQMCGGLSRLSVYSVRILVRSELIVVVNVTQLSFSPIRAAQSQSPFDASKFSWIEYSRESGEIHIYAYLNSVATTPTLITLNAIEPDLPSNTAYVFVSLRGNQLSTFYNCRLADAKMIADSATMSALTQTFFSASTQAVFGQVIFNRNLNDVFRAYGCVNMRRDAYEQIYSPTTSSLVKDYCQLTLNDLQRVNLQMAHLIDGIANDRQSSANFFALISSNLLTCSMKSKKC